MGQTRQEKILLEFETKYGKQGIKQLQSDLFAIKKDLAASQGKIIEFGKKVVLNQKLQQEKVKVAQQKIANSMSDAINKTSNFKDVNTMITEGIGQYNNRVQKQNQIMQERKKLMSEAINRSSNFKDVNTMITEGIGQYNNRLQTQRLLMQEAINKSSQFTSVQEMVSDAVNDYDYRARQAAATTKLQQEQMYGATITGHKYGKVLIKIHQSQQKMLMSMLGVMFFGMMLRQTFLGLLSPAAEAFGIFDMFGAMLLVTFIPIMQMLAEPLYTIMTWFMDLPEPIQKVVGGLVVLIGAFGAILAVVGMLGLGMNGIIDSIVKLGALTLDKTTGAVVGLGSNIDELKLKVANFGWGALAVTGWALAAIGAVYLIKLGLDALETSSTRGKEAVDALDEGFVDLLKNNFSPLISVFSDMKIEIADATELQIAWGAIVSSTLSSAITGFGAFGAMVRTTLNVITVGVQSFVLGFLKGIEWLTGAIADLAGAVGMNKVSDKLKDLKKGFKDPMKTLTDGITEDINDINDAWEKQTKLTQGLSVAQISPVEAIQAHRDKMATLNREKEANVDKLVNELLNKQLMAQNSPINSSALNSNPIVTNNNMNQPININQYNTIQTGANASDVTDNLAIVGADMLRQYVAKGGTGTGTY